MAAWFSRIFNAGAKPAEPAKTQAQVPFSPASNDLFAKVTWLNADDPSNPFNVRLLNCLSTAMGLTATTKSADVAARFSVLRKEDGRRHLGTVPEKPFEVACNLQYPSEHAIADGRVFISSEMEEKWDIFLYDRRLYFARSWSGDLQIVADVNQNERELRLSRIIAHSDGVAQDAAYAICKTDFLIKSHACNLRVPHPISPGIPDDAKTLAMWSFAEYGRRGFAATRSDTLPFGRDRLKAPPAA